MNRPVNKKTILMLVANPQGSTSLNLLPEVGKLQEALQRSLNREHFTIEWKVALQQEHLRRHILDIKPQIIHYCGHGTKEGLVIHDEKNQVKLLSNEFLVDLLKNFADRVECLVLNACDTEPLAIEVAKHINYAIGMNQEVKDQSAIAFSETFYDAIGAGEGIETAFEMGKNAVLGITSSGNQSRKLTVVGEDDSPVTRKNQEYEIPVLCSNPNPTEIKSLWLSPDQRKEAVKELLTIIEESFNKIKLFHASELIILENQYIPIQVTLERRYQDKSERLGSYAESEAEFKKLYALKGGGEEEIKRQQEDWQTAKQKELRIVVLADPGMGKSTLLRMEVIEAVKDSKQVLEAGKAVAEVTIPLFIRLSTLADEVQGGLTIKEAILTIVQERYDSIFLKSDYNTTQDFLKSFLTEQLEAGKCLLLLDALDEVPQEKRPQLLEKLNEFVSNYPNCRIIGTSRIVGYAGSLVNGAKEMEIVPFTQAQTEEYIQVWFTNAQNSLKGQSVKGEGLIKALQERPQLSGLAQNPLLLSLICSLYQQDQGTLPTKRGTIYEKSVNLMLKEWGQQSFNKNQFWIKAKVRLFEALAYHFSHQDQEVFSDDELFDWMEEYLDTRDAPRDLRDAKTGELITELLGKDGIIQKLSQSKDNEQYLFLHRTFQEYLTASYLSRQITKDETKGLDLVKSFLWDYDWHETIVLLAGLLKKPMVLIQAIMAEKDDIFKTQLLLAGRCLGECNQQSDPLVGGIINDIIDFWKNHPDIESIQSTLVQIGGVYNEAVEGLINALQDKDSSVRENAAIVLGKIGNEKAVESLIYVLQDEDPSVIDNVAEALRKIGNKKAVEALIYNIQNMIFAFDKGQESFNYVVENEKTVEPVISALQHEDSYIRAKAALILGEAGSEKAVTPLITALQDEYWSVRTRAAEALGKIGNEKAVEPLICALQDEAPHIRQNAAEALGKIGDEKAIEPLVRALQDEDKYEYDDNRFKYVATDALGKIQNEKGVEPLITALRDEDSSVRSSAAIVLGKIGNEKGVEPLIITLQDKDSSVRSIAADALGNIGNEKGVEPLIITLQDKDSSVRSSAAVALGNIGNEKGVEPLITALRDEDSSVRSSAAVALGNIGNEKAVEPLIITLKDELWTVRSNAADALGQIGNEKAVEPLIITLKDENWNVRTGAVDALVKTLVKIGNKKAVEPLIITLKNEDWDVRKKAVDALVKIGNKKAVKLLITALRDEDSYVRSSAADALGNIGNEKAVEPLIITLQDKDSEVRRNVVAALGNIGNEKAIEPLIITLQDKDIEVRRNVVAALDNIGNEKGVEPLITALRDEDRYVRWTAAVALGNIGNEQAVEPLITALRDEDSYVRSNAADALGQIGSLTILEKLLQSPDIKISDLNIFKLARKLAIKHQKSGSPFIPVYPELVQQHTPENEN